MIIQMYTIKLSKIKIFGLGGLAENGKNSYVVEIDNDIFVFEAGLKYSDDNSDVHDMIREYIRQKNYKTKKCKDGFI